MPLLGNDRAATAEEVKVALQAQGVAQVSVGDSFGENLDSALSSLSAGDRLVVFGSFFTVAAAMAEFADRLSAE